MPGLEFADYLAGGTVATLLAVALIAFVNEWVYTRGHVKALEKELRFWRRIALKGKGILSEMENELDMGSSE